MHRDGAARRGKIFLPHGEIDTPQFMPVGTAASVKAIAPDDLYKMDAQVVLGNTYHLLLRPGPEVIAQMGGLAERHSRWDPGGEQEDVLGSDHVLHPDERRRRLRAVLGAQRHHLRHGERDSGNHRGRKCRLQ